MRNSPYNPQPLPDHHLSAPLAYSHQPPFTYEEEDEQQTALLDFPIPAAQPPFSTVPLVQGAPLSTTIPYIQNPPSMAHNNISTPPGTQAGLTSPPLYNHIPSPVHPSPSTHGHLPSPHHHHKPLRHPQHKPLSPPPLTSNKGCAPVWLVLVFAAVLVLSSTLTFGFMLKKFNLHSPLMSGSIHQSSSTPPPTDVPTATDTPTTSATPTLTPSPSAPSLPSTTAGLSCLSPGSVSLGPVSEGYSSPISAQTSLCTTGSGTVAWTAAWNQQAAPWLQLNFTSGQIQAPAQQSVTVSALATNLKVGTYTAVVIFASQQSKTTAALNVTFTIQTGCLHTSQQQLNFSGVEGVSDPAVQTLAITNCGVIGAWATSISTNNNVQWLSVTPTNGTFNSGATQQVTVSASNRNANLRAGIYQGKMVFAIGSNQVTVSVTLYVQAKPRIVLVVPASGSFYANKDCSYNASSASWSCIASISNSSSNQSLSWQASSTGVSNITFKPGSDTLSPGSSERIVITVPANNCQMPTMLTFTGPTNVVNIAWSCSTIS